MSSTNLDNVLEILTLLFQGLVQNFQSWQGGFGHHFGQRNMHGGREGIVARLSFIDVVVWMHWLLGSDLASQNLNGAIGQYLIDVHVGLGT